MTLGEYTSEFIYNNKITAKDVVEGTTGFNYWNSLDPKTRSRLSQEHRKIWESMTPDPQARFIADFEAILRAKQRAANGKLKTLDNYDIIRQIVNVDAPRAIADIMSYLDRHHKLEELAELKSKETFVETAIAALRMMQEGKIIIINPNEL